MVTLCFNAAGSKLEVIIVMIFIIINVFASVCRYGFLNLACSIGVIRIHDSTFGVYSNQTFCDPDFTYCDNISTAVNYPFHTEIRRKCFGKEFCSVRSSVGEVPEALCHRPFSDIVKITYCCVLNPYTPCQGILSVISNNYNK